MKTKTDVPQGFSQDLMRYESVLKPIAYKLTRNKQEMEDLVQDTFYRALSNSEKFSYGTNIRAWLLTIMRNNFINGYHKKLRGTTLLTTTNGQYFFNDQGRVSKNDSARTFIAEDINKAMEEVSKDFSEPFLMYYEGFHYEEIAQKLNVPLGTIKSRIFSARKVLKEKLEKIGVVNAGTEIYEI